jgi:DNA-binding HxlR family transcriptional regulator
VDPDRIYRHFCMMARALEVVGERWSLLIVRDLQLGPRRFTDLGRSLNEITPTRLTVRLRQLEAAGVIAREPSVRGREIWYRLTDAGAELGPVIDALTLWGIEHARRPPAPDEPVHSEAVMIGTKVWLNRNADASSDGLTWVWRFSHEESYTLRFSAGTWQLSRGEAESATIAVETMQHAWASFLTMPREKRRLPATGIRLEGSRADVRGFAKTFRAELAPARE